MEVFKGENHSCFRWNKLHELTLMYAVRSVHRGSVGPGVGPENVILPSIVMSRHLGNFGPEY